MKKFIFSILIIVLICNSCVSEKTDFVIAFGSCNKQYEENVLWKEIIKHNPNVWIWGGDNVYSDTRDMNKLKNDYDKVLQNVEYQTLTKSSKILGTWDDHDYGLNDGGIEFDMKKESQQLLLDFLGVPIKSTRRKQEGVYMSQVYNTPNGDIKVIVLDTRYFRSALTKSKVSGKRYDPNYDENSTILGENQWNWLTQELKNSKAKFHVIVSSIQFLSSEHGFETWGNFPKEQEKLKQLITDSKVSNPIILSGDRHISEFSLTKLDGRDYPLIDFTSSGLTHSYSNFTSEPNKFRSGKVVSEISFGLIKFDLKSKSVVMEMRGKNNVLQQQIIQQYE